MTYELAKAVLMEKGFRLGVDASCLEAEGALDGPTFMYTDWHPESPTACLDGSFEPDVLEAIACWMRQHRIVT